ncbi:BON domain-containing protein [Luteibacter sp. UNCMF331Sha3.1]|uniref:BON domain-containing protein n=1 Tax=Luteibacter sp. UNCMF331Sha3.1 TaxID=1502760 RepID=UPI0004B21662|nr:BON domain-containing protein [Luteibacter sp. UNCMF331Sha3.1]SEN13882.1 BON domain-containing protein [Luteibacter sp. UNCMF331Sha3.1]
MNRSVPALFLLGLAVAVPAMAQDTTKVDNTAINQRDRHAESATPMDQPNNAEDIRLAAAVRKAIVADDALSTMGQNVKFIATKGIVTLRGPVKDDAEKARIEALVKGVAGVSHVENQLDIKH